MKLSRAKLAPEEGWASVFLVGLMALTMAWSIGDAGWVLGRSEWTNFLPWAALLGVAVGFIGAKAGWSRLVAHVIGATFAALIVPVMVGSVLLDGGGTPGSQFAATAAATVKAWNDLIVLGHSGDPRHGPPPAGPRAALLEHRTVRGLCRLPPPPAAERGRRRRGDPRSATWRRRSAHSSAI